MTKSSIPAWLLAVAATLPVPTQAEDPAALRLAQDRGCFECHAIGWEALGPAFVDVAARYRRDPQAREMLVDIVRFGGKRHWGERFNMWPQTNLSDVEAYQLVDWILSQD